MGRCESTSRRFASKGLRLVSGSGRRGTGMATSSISTTLITGAPERRTGLRGRRLSLKLQLDLPN